MGEKIVDVVPRTEGEAEFFYFLTRKLGALKLGASQLFHLFFLPFDAIFERRAGPRVSRGAALDGFSVQVVTSGCTKPPEQKLQPEALG